MMKEQVRVIKFGGTSVGDAACIQRVARIIADSNEQCGTVAVVSAMSGVTNLLVSAAHRAVAGDERVAAELGKALRQQHAPVIAALVKDAARQHQLLAEIQRIIDETVSLCRGTALLGELTPRALDAMSSVGERLSARIMAGALGDLGIESAAIDATELIVTNNHHGQAEPEKRETGERARARLLPLLAEGAIPIVTGFIGATRDGVLTTLGRGGSDYSATILGAALEAAEIIIWTDVDGVLSADPRLVPEAGTIDEISYHEATALAAFGAQVLHPKTLRPVMAAGIPVWIRNSFAPQRRGTRITAAGQPSRSGVKAITATSEASLISVSGDRIGSALDTAAHTFWTTANGTLAAPLILQMTSQNEACLIVHSADAGRLVETLRQTLALDPSHLEEDEITVNPGMAVVAVVGERVRRTPGIAGRIFSALGRAGVNVLTITLGTSEHYVSFVVEASEMRRSLAIVHREFELEPGPMREGAEQNARNE